eukprot:CAMPEP_0175167820 /NCGR_PEP_ID=MMETSP0087-20121206/28578_1 /TAXON_ID=136419 /ORGANISM="Unknown Unknown, Strain D1" /LENGTH=83 /DNA_ID=CAMNT_0016457799 /DNA_START=25 /DNA_END=274 /DNA_ORIENTATION=-
MTNTACLHSRQENRSDRDKRQEHLSSSLDSNRVARFHPGEEQLDLSPATRLNAVFCGCLAGGGVVCCELLEEEQEEEEEVAEE